MMAMIMQMVLPDKSIVAILLGKEKSIDDGNDNEDGVAVSVAAMTAAARSTQIGAIGRGGGTCNVRT